MCMLEETPITKEVFNDMDGKLKEVNMHHHYEYYHCSIHLYIWSMVYAFSSTSSIRTFE